MATPPRMPKAAEMAAVTNDGAIRPIAQTASSRSGRSSSNEEYGGDAVRQTRPAIVLEFSSRAAGVLQAGVDGVPVRWADQASPISWLIVPVPPQLPHARPSSVRPVPVHCGHTASPLSGEPGGTSSPGFIAP